MATYLLDSADAAEKIVGLAMGGEYRPRADRATGVVKLSPDGRPTCTSGMVVARPDGGHDRSVTVAVIETGTAYPLGTRVRVDGKVWVTPYLAGDGSSRALGLSVVAERLVPMDLPAASNKRGEAS